MDTRANKRSRRKYDSRGKLIITRLSLHEQVVNQLREMIVTGELAAGEKIRVGDLAEQLDVSLTPLREALKVLAGEQLVELMPNRGARVAPLTVEDTRQLFEVIAGIEAIAAERTAARIDDDELAELEETHARMRQHHENGEKDEYFELNRRIHDLVVDYSGNPILAQVRSQLARRAERARFISVRSGSRRDEAMQDHEDLMEALRTHDAKAAHDIWRRHLTRSGEETCRVLKIWEQEAEGEGDGASREAAHA